MRFRLTVVVLAFCWSPVLLAQGRFKLLDTGVLERGVGVLDINYTGPAPPATSPYLASANWKVRWSAAADAPAIAVTVTAVSVDETAQKLRLHLTGNLPVGDSDVHSYWTALFDPPDGEQVLPKVVPVPPSASVSPESVKKDCSNTQPSGRPYLCPPGPKQTPDLGLSGSFLAAGGTKPIYSLSLSGNLALSRTMLSFHPGVATEVEINQSVRPPSNRTRFDPDSIRGGLAFTRIISIQRSVLYGARLQMVLPGGEFSRSDSSANIVAGAMSEFVLNPWQSSRYKSLYATLYPVLGFEAGDNLEKPSRIGKIPVNLAGYDGIFRGVAGGSVALAVASPDRKANIFAITASYRVRLPATDEPFVRSVHQITTVELTTRARHWIEADITYSPWTWKYLSLDAKYQYGELPPLFTLVEHKFTLGLTLQAVQSRKPNIPSTLK